MSSDVINERTVTTADFSNKGYTQQRDYLDSAARIEAANDLTIGAGRNVLNTGGVITSGRDTDIEAGRDIGIVSAEQQSSDTGGKQKSSVTQFGSSINAGRDITMSAGRDMNIVASDITAKRNIDQAVEGDMTIASGADESHSYYKTKKSHGPGRPRQTNRQHHHGWRQCRDERGQRHGGQLFFCGEQKLRLQYPVGTEGLHLPMAVNLRK